MTESDIQALYRAFNDRDAARVLSSMAPDIDWPNGWEGGRVAGKEAVGAYWRRQWEAIDPKVYPVDILLSNDTITVTVHQVVKSLTGETLSDSHVIHCYTLQDGVIARMDITDASD